MCIGSKGKVTITPCACLLTHDIYVVPTHDTGVVRNIGKLNIGKETLSRFWLGNRRI